MHANDRAFARRGFNIKGATRAFSAFAHLHESNTAARMRRDKAMVPSRIRAIIAHFLKLRWARRQGSVPPTRDLLRVLANVVERFLDQPEQRDFDFGRETLVSPVTERFNSISFACLKLSRDCFKAVKTPAFRYSSGRSA